MLAHTRIDRYEIKDVLGHGGMGVVYKAYDSNRKGFVALKTMKDAADPAALELFNQEWRTLANGQRNEPVERDVVLPVGEGRRDRAQHWRLEDLERIGCRH